MPVVEQVLDRPRDYARIELAMATTLPPADAARVFSWLATYPWQSVTWFGPGHTIRWYSDPGTFPLGSRYEAVLLLDDPAPLAPSGPNEAEAEAEVEEADAAPPTGDIPDLSGFSVGDDPVRWLWVIPITEQIRVQAKEHGSATAVTRLAEQGRTWIATS
jgi:hypothetical protein